jgi:predicted GTPase
MWQRTRELLRFRLRRDRYMTWWTCRVGESGADTEYAAMYREQLPARPGLWLIKADDRAGGG